MPMNDPVFRQWLTDRYGLTPEEAGYTPAQFLRADGWFDVGAWELWLRDRYREFRSTVVL
jgi:hypothetical protein